MRFVLCYSRVEADPFYSDETFLTQGHELDLTDETSIFNKNTKLPGISPQTITV